ncbi:MAG: hypothetical protein KDC33_09800 [Thermoleophilia bacterium]|nr:hypothetical protein [Thermoleophilia bacterium]
MSPPRRHQAGQGVLEMLVALPVLALVAALAWQVVAVAWAGVRAEEAVRAAALDAAGPPGRPLRLERAASVPGPLGAGHRVVARAVVLP